MPRFTLLLVAILIAGSALPAAAQSGGMGPDLVLEAEALDLARPLTIADRHFIWRRSDGLAEQVQGLAPTVTIRCAPAYPRDSAYSNCLVQTLANAPEALQQPLERVLNRYLDVGSFYIPRDLQERLTQQRNTAVVFITQLLLDDLLPPADAVAERKVTPVVAITGNRFVERLRDDYPPRALRNGWQGTLHISCLINADHSVSCEGLSFDPPEHFEFFRDVVERRTLMMRIPDTLSDGTPAAGAQFETRLRYVFADDYPAAPSAVPPVPPPAAAD